MGGYRKPGWISLSRRRTVDVNVVTTRQVIEKPRHDSGAVVEQSYDPVTSSAQQATGTLTAACFTRAASVAVVNGQSFAKRVWKPANRADTSLALQLRLRPIRPFYKRSWLKISGYTGSQTEILWASAQAGTNATYAAGTEQSLMGGLAPCVIPGFYFLNIAKQGGTLRLKASGQITCISAVTWTFAVCLIPSTNTFAAGTAVKWATAAMTAPASVTLGWWFLDFDLVMRNINSGATSIVAGSGELSSPLGLATPNGGSLPASNVSPQISTYDNSLNYFLHVSLASSSASASNLANIQMGKLYGEN